jgi:O-antigen/teichoic acid export membrane protein
MQGANTFAQVLSNVYVPVMAGKALDKPHLKMLSNRLFLQMLLLGTVSMLVFAWGAKPITHILYGTHYEELVALMPWFGVLLLLRYVAASHGVTLSAVGLQSTRVLAISVALVTLFTATYFLIPQFELIGMLFASVIALSCLAIVYAGTLRLRGFPLGISTFNAVALTMVISMTWFTLSQ